MGSGHRVSGNRFLHLNTAGCNESAAQASAFTSRTSREIFESGIYLGRGFGRLEETRGNMIRDNVISGHKHENALHRLRAGRDATANTLQGNTCSDDEPDQVT